MAGKPDSIAIFGASGRIGAPLAAHLRAMAPDVRLHLLSSSDAQAADLQLAFPSDTVAVADYLKLDDVKRAVKNTEAVFVVTPHFLNEQRAMENLVLALRETRGLKQVSWDTSPAPLLPKFLSLCATLVSAWLLSTSLPKRFWQPAGCR